MRILEKRVRDRYIARMRCRT